MLDPAELGAARDVRPRRRLEPRLVHAAGDGVDLAAEPRHPPAVVDVVRGRGDVEVDDRVGRRDHLVHGRRLLG